jgi:hypothetical protein
MSHVLQTLELPLKYHQESSAIKKQEMLFTDLSALVRDVLWVLRNFEFTGVCISATSPQRLRRGPEFRARTDHF